MLAQLARLVARRRGIQLMGIVDFDVLDGVDEFLAACDLVGVRGSAGVETRVFLPEFASREINSPGEPGVSYHIGIGFTSSQAPALLTIYLGGNLVGHINLSWVSPVKIRQTLIGGTSKMIVYDDNQPSEKVKIYDKGVELNSTSKEEIYQLKVQYRVGDMYSPKLEDHEALALETEHFVDCVSNAKMPLTGGSEGLEVVKVLVAAQESLKNRGLPVGL